MLANARFSPLLLFSSVVIFLISAEVDLKALADAKMLKRMRILEEQVGLVAFQLWLLQSL